MSATDLLHDLPFHNPDLPLEDRVRDLLGRLSLEEKAAQMLHEAPAVERLGIPAYDWWSEGLHGVARAGRATVFPQAIGLAAAFDADLVHRVATAISDEARAKHHAAVALNNRGRYRGLTLWSPNINIFRDPRWGRGQETYGEDPCLTGRLGAAFVRGLQGDDPRYLKTAACAKHYAVHSGPEADRHVFDARVSPRDLWDTYLPAFQELVGAGVESVMGAYNRVNGEPCCSHPVLLGEILRETWGFQGHVVSDCWALVDIWKHHQVVSGPAQAAARAVKNGCDLCCGCVYEHIPDAVRNGLLDEADVDRALARLLRTRFKLGLFDPPARVPYASIPASVINCDTHRELAREAARRSIVLLKNNGILPLRRDARSIHVLGPNAAAVEPLLGNYYGASARLVTALEGIVEAVDDGCSVEYKHGCLLDRPSVNPIDWVTGEAARADVALCVMGLSPLLEGEEGESIASPDRGDRSRVELPEGQIHFLRTLKQKGARIVVVLMTGSALAIPEVHELADAVLVCWYPGEEGGHALADVLFGDASPAGRLPVSFPCRTEDLPPYAEYAMAGRTYRYATTAPLYPFGFGLTYSPCLYREPRLSASSVARGQSLTLTVRIENPGPRDTDEVAQLYLSDLESSAPAPLYALKDFHRVRVPAGQSVEVAFAITPRLLELVDESGHRVLEPGRFRATVGGACPHPRSLELGAPAPVTAEFELV